MIIKSKSTELLQNYPSKVKQKSNEVFPTSKDEPIKKTNPAQSSKKMLGRWAMVNTGYDNVKIISINYSDDSTINDPIMCTRAGEKIHINNIDPSNASQLEMQMYCAHLDAIGMGTNNKFGTYQDLKTVRMSSEINGFVPKSGLQISNLLFKSKKRNWIDLTNKVMAVVQSNDRELYLRLEKMISSIEYYRSKQKT